MRPCSPLVYKLMRLSPEAVSKTCVQRLKAFCGVSISSVGYIELLQYLKLTLRLQVMRAVQKPLLLLVTKGKIHVWLVNFSDYFKFAREYYGQTVVFLKCCFGLQGTAILHF